jgi:hypothetical protein
MARCYRTGRDERRDDSDWQQLMRREPALAISPARAAELFSIVLGVR